MAGKCGCGDHCDCLVEGGLGTDVPGTGDEDNPYIVNIDGSEVSGPGIGWQDAKFTVRIVPGRGLEFDPAGSLFVTDGSTPPDAGRATVAALEDRAQDVIGGSIGAGFLIKPADQLATFQYGLQQGIDFMHVPVRFLGDGSPVVRISETMARSSDSPTRHVQDLDPHQWRVTNSQPAYDIHHRFGETLWLNQPPPDAPRTGWFGYLEPGQLGLTFLSDVFREVGGKIVLVLDLRFPARDSGGGFAHDTPSWRTDLFLTQVKKMILHFGLTNSVIVTSTETDVPSAVTPPTRRVLEFFSDSGIRVGPYLESATAAAAHPPDVTWPAAWTWVFLSRSIPRETLQLYIDKPLHSILFIVTRQYLRGSLVNLPDGVGAKGVISADPEYYAGELFNHRYRSPLGGVGGSVLASPTIKHGLLPSGDEALTRMSWAQRGAGRIGYAAMWLGPEIPKAARSVSSYVLQGYLGPHPTPTSCGYDLGTGFDQIPGTGWMAFAFGVATDHGFADRQVGETPDPVNYPLDSGYVLLVQNDGVFYLIGYDYGGGTLLGSANPYGQPLWIGHPDNPDQNRGMPLYYRIGVNANGIKVSRITGIGATETGTVIIQSTTDLAKAHRGPYAYFGRYSQVAMRWDGYHEVAPLPNGNPPIGPA